MRKFYSLVVKNPKKILVLFIILDLCGAVLQNLVEVNYDMTDYLPANSDSTVSLDIMHGEFDGGIPNARVMINDVSIAEALEYKEKLKNCEGTVEFDHVKFGYEDSDEIIIHDLSTIKNSDLILVMKNGDIIESGTHELLLAENGFYAELYNSQFDKVS